WPICPSAERIFFLRRFFSQSAPIDRSTCGEKFPYVQRAKKHRKKTARNIRRTTAAFFRTSYPKTSRTPGKPKGNERPYGTRFEKKTYLCNAYYK
ncbi:MAG: hypothetical protein LUC45_07535, partial [Paraprevotella sp.]|nr:hypothetical protein [Paraprevotella sp.]